MGGKSEGAREISWDEWVVKWYTEHKLPIAHELVQRDTLWKKSMENYKLHFTDEWEISNGRAYHYEPLEEHKQKIRWSEVKDNGRKE